jgi:hypothetical protein
LNALYQLGIPAQLALVPAGRRFSYADRAEALADIRWCMRRLPDPQVDRAIESAIDDLLEREDDGRLAVRGVPEQIAVIWWEPASAAVAERR